MKSRSLKVLGPSKIHNISKNWEGIFPFYIYVARVQCDTNYHYCFCFQIEEEITEEITEYISDKEETSTSSRSVTKSGPWLSSQPSLGNSIDCILAELNSEDIVGSATVFPEFGVDIVLHHKHGKEESYSYMLTSKI